jgi:hypothetical protein
MIAPVATQFSLECEYRKLEYLCAFFAGASHRTNITLRGIGTIVWLASLVIHFAFDVNEAIKVYGFTYLASQGVWVLNFVIGTLTMRYRILPWLLEGLKELRRDECYEKTITNVLKMLKVIFLLFFYLNRTTSLLTDTLSNLWTDHFFFSLKQSIG